MIQKIKQFFLEARSELKHVNWPTRAEAIRLTSIVILISLAIAVFLGIFDVIFRFGLQEYLIKF